MLSNWVQRERVNELVEECPFGRTDYESGRCMYGIVDEAVEQLGDVYEIPDCSVHRTAFVSELRLSGVYTVVAISFDISANDCSRLCWTIRRGCSR